MWSGTQWASREHLCSATDGLLGFADLGETLCSLELAFKWL